MYSVSNLERENDYPNISICMPIYNRNNFKRLILSNLLKLDYDFNKIEFCLYDDGTEPFFIDKEEKDHFINIIKPITFKYKYEKNKKEIGEKRNLLTKMATHKFIACMDSDDLYMPSPNEAFYVVAVAVAAHTDHEMRVGYYHIRKVCYT